MRFALFASALALFPVPYAGAANISMGAIPSVRLEQGWDSNIFNASIGEVSDFYFRARPELALNWGTPGAGVTLTGSVEGTWYYNNPDATRDPTWNFTLGISGGEAVQITEGLSVVPSVYYIDTVNSFRRTELLPTGDPVVPPVTIASYANTRSQDFGGGLNFSYLATPNVTIGLGGSYGERRFPGNPPGSGLYNSTTIGGSTSVSYLFAPGTSLGVRVAGGHQTYEDNPVTDTFYTGILFTYPFSPSFSVNGTVGLSLIRQEAGPAIPEQNSSAPSGWFNAGYTAGTFSVNAYGSASYSSGSGFGQATRQGTVGFGIGDKFAPEWSWNIGGSYQISRSAFGSQSVNLATLYGNGGMSYMPWELVSFYLNGNFSSQSSDGQFLSPADRYSIVLGVTFGKSFNIF